MVKIHCNCNQPNLIYSSKIANLKRENIEILLRTSSIYWFTYLCCRDSWFTGRWRWYYAVGRLKILDFYLFLKWLSNFQLLHNYNGAKQFCQKFNQVLSYLQLLKICWLYNYCFFLPHHLHHGCQIRKKVIVYGG